MTAMQSSCGQHTQVLNPEEMQAWRAFLAAAMSVTGKLNHELEAALGLSMHEYEILVRLAEAPEHTLRMSALAAHVCHSRSRLTHTVGRLENKGYVSRSSCCADRRGVNCHLTDAGQQFLRSAAPLHLTGVRRHVIDRLDPHDLATFTVLMQTLARPCDEV